MNLSRQDSPARFNEGIPESNVSHDSLTQGPYG